MGFNSGFKGLMGTKKSCHSQIHNHPLVEKK